jgi:hypothetical protein
MKELHFDYDRFTGINETYIKDEMTGKIAIKKQQHVEPILDQNKIEAIDNGSWKGDMHKVATIPLIVIDMWREELKAMGCEDTNPLSAQNRKFFYAKLNSPEWNKLRTKEGRI